MRLLPSICLAVALPALAQQPSIATIQNNYSYIYPGSPNYGIAQGSLFIIEGSRLAPSTQSAILNAPGGLPTSLNGVSVTVSVNGTTSNAYIYYIYAANGITQIGAVLPSNVPVGTGTVTVTNGLQSATGPIVVVRTAVGLATLSGTGTGRATAQDGSGNLLSSTNAANPGQTIVLWGTGAGPDLSNDDHTYLQSQNNLTNLPLEVDIGGITATITYRGRSAYPGVDQFNVTIPASVATGCYVSVVAFAGAYIGNFASIPVAASGSTCTDPVPGFGLSFNSSSNTLVQGVQGNVPVNVMYGAELKAANATSDTTMPITVGNIVYGDDNQPPTVNPFGIPSPKSIDSAYATFLTYSPLALYYMLSEYMVSEGSCTVFPAFSQSLTGAGSGLNAGASISIAASGRSATLNPTGTGIYQAGISQNLIGSSPGNIAFGNGSGGSGVGAFNTSFTYPLPALVWNEQNTLTTVTRSQPLTVTWSGGVPGTAVVISGFAGAAPSPQAPQGGTKFFLCVAPVSAQNFTVPVSVLSSLPSTAALATAYVAVSNSTIPTSFSASGITEGWISGLIYDNVGVVSGTFRFK